MSKVLESICGLLAAGFFVIGAVAAFQEHWDAAAYWTLATIALTLWENQMHRQQRED